MEQHTKKRKTIELGKLKAELLSTYITKLAMTFYENADLDAVYYYFYEQRGTCHQTQLNAVEIVFVYNNENFLRSNGYTDEMMSEIKEIDEKTGVQIRFTDSPVTDFTENKDDIVATWRLNAGTFVFNKNEQLNSLKVSKEECGFGNLIDFVPPIAPYVEKKVEQAKKYLKVRQ